MRRHGLRSNAFRSRYLCANIAMNSADDAAEAGKLDTALKEYAAAIEGFREDEREKTPRDPEGARRSRTLRERCEAAVAALAGKDVAPQAPAVSTSTPALEVATETGTTSGRCRRCGFTACTLECLAVASRTAALARTEPDPDWAESYENQQEVLEPKAGTGQ